MRLTTPIAIAAISFASLAFAQETPAPAPAAPAAPAAAAEAVAFEYAVMRTNKGDIVIELDRAKAPITVENFVGYIKDGFFDGTVFHRIVPGFVIQGGGFTVAGEQKKNKPPIANEWKNGLKNKRGTLSMARTNNPKSATSQFFISLKDNDMLDQPVSGGAGYAVFGRVLVGMEVVDAIARARTTQRFGMNDWPIEDIVVSKAEMISKEEAEKRVADKPAAPAAPAAPKKPDAPADGGSIPAKPADPAKPAGEAPAAPNKAE